MYICRKVALSLNEGLDLRFIFQCTVSNMISQIAFGRRFDYDDPTFFAIIQAMVSRTSGANPIRAPSFPEWFLELPWIKSILRNLIAEGDRVRAYLGQIMGQEKIRCEALGNETPLSYVDAFVRRQKEGDGQHFSEQQLLMSIHNLFEAGTETTATTITWAVIYLIRHPDIQERVHAEIVSVLGSQRLPTMADKPNLPLTEAVILEASRIATLVPDTPRQVTPGPPLKYGKYVLKEGDFVVFSIFCLHMDPQTWGDPSVFRPERFLTEGMTEKFYHFFIRHHFIANWGIVFQLHFKSMGLKKVIIIRSISSSNFRWSQSGQRLGRSCAQLRNWEEEMLGRGPGEDGVVPDSDELAAKIWIGCGAWE